MVGADKELRNHIRELIGEEEYIKLRKQGIFATMRVKSVEVPGETAKEEVFSEVRRMLGKHGVITMRAFHPDKVIANKDALKKLRKRDRN